MTTPETPEHDPENVACFRHSNTRAKCVCIEQEVYRDILHAWRENHKGMPNWESIGMAPDLMASLHKVVMTHRAKAASRTEASQPS